MGRELQKKKNRSSLNKVTRRKQNKKKTIIKGSELIRENWNKNETMAQNYARLGLTHRMSEQTGGTEKTGKYETKNASSLNRRGPTEAIIERDENGEVVKITYKEPLTLDELENYNGDQNGDNSAKTEIIKQLEDRAAMAVSTERKQSDREQEWVQRLVEKHGDDYEAMFWDKRLNVMQQSVGDLKRRVKKWKESQKKKTITAA